MISIGRLKARPAFKRPRHHSGDSRCPGAFRNHFLPFNQSQDRAADLVVADKGDLVHIVSDQGEGVRAGLFDCDTVRKCGDGRKTLDLSVFD